MAKNNILWVLEIADKILKYPKEKVGIFGVNGIGALMSCLFPDKIEFIADEDSAKQNMKFADKKIISPKESKKEILVAFRNVLETKRIVGELKNKYPYIDFINLCEWGK
ncbi:hypothetical protein B6S12_03090 [Helicobacter valdiviensis]|uniref:Uncharacterized protein n=1 Tax=Helicobacter valdiviensis TaxID=1458358 RepID=A0A2W6MVV3_9HELI|nr:hypothetical protein [Helicobacter valdiviensis]PZT48635.1 hypothetical protein B6S12_03090 [Helicobacter valdiviensis]